jgi:hypothetical protein
MVEIATKIKSPGERLRERAARKIGTMKRPGIRVEPRDEDMRRLLRHEPSGIRFRSEGSVEWPDDIFTHRRIKDGSVRVVEENKPRSGQTRHHSQAQAHPRHRDEGPSGTE